MRLAFYSYFLFFYFLSTTSLFAQTATLKVPLIEVQSTVEAIYNLEFSKARAYTSDLQAKHPEHPVIPLLKALQLYWQYLPIQNHPSELKAYLHLLQQSIQAIDKTFGASSTHPEAIFYTIVTRGHLAMCYHYQNELLKAAGEAKKAYNALIKGQSLVEEHSEFYFTSGLYNYYIEVYPEKRPIVKPVIWFFSKGSKARGLEQLKIASRKAIISKAEAHFYLVHIYLEYENKPELALQYSKSLANLFPKNAVYRMIYLESLLHTHHYEQADQLLRSSPLPSKPFFQIGESLFKGIIEEFLHKNLQEAENHYKKALAAPVNDQYTGEYPSLALNGLARIAIAKGNTAAAKEFYKKSLKTADYKSTIAEATHYLNK